MRSSSLTKELLTPHPSAPLHRLLADGSAPGAVVLLYQRPCQYVPAPGGVPIVLSVNRLKNGEGTLLGATRLSLRISCVSGEFKLLLSRITMLLFNELRVTQGLRAFGAVPSILMAVATLTGWKVSRLGFSGAKRLDRPNFRRLTSKPVPPSGRTGQLPTTQEERCRRTL